MPSSGATRRARRLWFWRGRVGSLLTPLAAVAAVLVQPLAALPPLQPVVCSLSEVACENQLAGDPASEWDLDDGGSPTITGFTTDISVNVGSTVRFKIDVAAPVSPYTIDIYRMGYYQGHGARHITSVTPSAPPADQTCLSSTEPNPQGAAMVDCGNWIESASWDVPASAVSGVHFARIRRTDTGAANHVVFIVRDDEAHSDMVFQTSDTTWQAYNRYGGTNFYPGPEGRAVKLSYNRPFSTRTDVPYGRDWVFANEYPMIRWLERNGYDITYQSGVDTDRLGSLLTNHKIFLSVGHDEYWSGAQRAHVEAARDAGVNLAFFSGNEVYWKTRYEPSIDGTSTPYRTLVTYKETWDNNKTDPTSEWTGTWRDPRFTPPSDGGRPENGLTGTIYEANCCNQAITVPAADGRMRLWRHTSVNTLAPGTTATLAWGTLGYEYDAAPDNGHQPAGLVRMSTTDTFTEEKLLDHGTVVGPGEVRHNLVLHRAASGALVFGAGTVQWAWGLDEQHDGPDNPEQDPRMQQATLNLFADMGVFPTTRQGELFPASETTDETAPTSTVTAPSANATVTGGRTVTITGTAADVGGQVGVVEVSTDEGQTWHTATGRESWSYAWTVNGFGPTVIKVRATDDSANIQATPTSHLVNIGCPCTAFGTDSPVTVETRDQSPVSLGVKFRTDRPATVTGVRFYKGPGNVGTHTGSIWSTNGTRLRTGTFTGESASGWQTLVFNTPLAVEPDTTYVASYFAPQGRYSADINFFNGRSVGVSPVELLADGVDGDNGVYGYGGDVFPTTGSSATNYGVDVIVDAVATPDTNPPVPTPVSPPSGATMAPRDTTVSVRFNEPVQASTINLTLRRGATGIPGTTSYDPLSRIATFTPSAPLDHATTYTASVAGVVDAKGNAMPAPFTWNFATVGPPRVEGVCPCSVFADDAVPQTTAISDPSPVEVGMRFRADVNGVITGIRFYKGPGNTGTHIGNLWTNTGTKLASVTFSAEMPSGWQQANLSTPVEVTAGQTYVVSYFAPNGRYSATAGQFASTIQRGPLDGLASGVDGQNGVYVYGPTSTFPTNSYNSANYWVDVVFEIPPDVTPPTVLSASPGAGTPAAPVASPVTVTFSEPIQAGSATVNVTGPGGAVAGTTTYDSATRTATFAPSASLAFGTTYTVTVSGARDLVGNLMTQTAWSFTTDAAPRPEGVCPCSVFAPGTVPVTLATNDPKGVELGMRFRPSVGGTVTGVRFYKGPGNTGTHVGNLWTSTGVHLASVTFTGETTSGWQQAAFSAPVPVTAGETYVVSYFAPNGHYSATAGRFASAVQYGPLTGLADGDGGANGLFRYAAAGGFPTESWNATSYAVDVVFQPTPDTTLPAVATLSPPQGATTAPVGTSVTATFSEPVQPETVAMTLTRTGGAAVAGTVGYDVLSRTVTFDPGADLLFGTSYTATVSGARDLAGNLMAPRTWTFTTEAAAPAPGQCPCTLFAPTATPAIAAVNESSGVELGVRFRSDENGLISGIRFYKGPGNTGTHVGNLWTTTGTKLATVTFENELATGWQEATFSTPVPVTAGTTYIASYFAPNGHYSLTGAGFATSVDRGPLHAPADGAGGAANGLFTYSPTGGFPTSSFNAGNYFVDVVFERQQDTVAPTVTATRAGSGATSVRVGDPVKAVFSEPVQPATVAVSLTGPGGPVAGTTTYDAATRTATFTPSGSLAAAATHTATVSGARDEAGNLLAPHTWSFTTAGACPCSTFASDALPAAPAHNDPAAVTVGMRFTPTVTGQVTAIRFYKGPGNTGTHTGSLWSASGEELATVSWAGESATGWQVATLGTPVTVTSGTTYEVSYFAPAGRYAANSGFFGQPYVNGPLTGVQGLYRYGTTHQRPTDTSNANYWVDVVFSPGT